MASSSSTLLVPLGSSSGKRISANYQGISCAKVRGVLVRCSNSELTVKAARSRGYMDQFCLTKRRDMIGLLLGVSSLVTDSFEAEGAGLPPEEKPRLCDGSCEKELENIPMVTTESGLQYKDIKVGQGPSPPVGFQFLGEGSSLYISCWLWSEQVIKGLDEGILSMKIGGKRRLYIPGSLAFPKGLNSAPGRPRVAPSSPVIFDVSLEYVPGLEIEEE
ncbi:peptidyl-prolyl cis-trans isomerase FKBP16-3, chloroplastic isoform X2 [Prunus dulcis]|uniref:peptidyl-prolyl cis-trans isomerase FKBP16-3, chloroplastic isoform X2 n=1 Tax=Prunus dulcis TaxID=3755 RepID=UPI00148385F2|nr:peptidyl-prolyl cis-trans isomerase FKBP16-3, chloroplastic isoform X2 [Prunus dulcis]